MSRPRSIVCVAAVTVLVAAHGSWGQAERRVVETTVELEAVALARGTREGVRLEDGAIVLEGARGGLETAEIAATASFDRLCACVNAETPGTATVEVLARVTLEDGARSPWLSLGVVGAPAAEVPRSVAGPASDAFKVAIDTVEIAGQARSLALRVVLARGANGETPRVRRLCAVAWPRGQCDVEQDERAAWGKVLAVPERSQRVEAAAIEGRICSPTSLSMVLAFHGLERPTKDVAAEVLDKASGIYGNWALNVAFAGRLGLEARIARCGSFAPLEREIAAGRPAVISHRWKAGELTGSPVSETDGHLIVVRGFTREGDLVVNDPAADPRRGQKIERTYLRRELARTWLENADGIAYFLRRP